MYNQVIMIGNLTADPKVYESGANVITNFTVATNYKYKDKQDTYYGDCKAFNKTAEFCRAYMKKGIRVFVTGRLTTDTWEKEGEKKSKTSIVVETIKLLSSKDSFPHENATDEPF